MISTKLILRKDKLNKAGKAPIYLRITRNRKHAYINTGVKTEPSYWDNPKQKLKSNFKNSVAANTLLKHFIHKSESVAYEFVKEGKNFSAQNY